MSESRGLTPLQLDALREVGNIGSGNAAVALSTMVDKKVLLSVPRASLVPLVKVSDLVGGAETPVVGVYLHISGDASGSMLLLLAESSAAELADLMVADPEEELTTVEQSALQETGSILTRRPHGRRRRGRADNRGAVGLAGDREHPGRLVPERSFPDDRHPPQAFGSRICHGYGRGHNRLHPGRDKPVGGLRSGYRDGIRYQPA